MASRASTRANNYAEPGAPRQVLALRDECMWVMRAAEALFPLVPRACSAVVAGAGEPPQPTSPAAQRPPLAAPRPGGLGQLLAVHLVLLGWSGRRWQGGGGEVRGVAWMLGRREKARARPGDPMGHGGRVRTKECMAVLRGLCGGHMDSAVRFVGPGDGGAATPSTGSTPGDSVSVQGSGEAVCKGGQLQVAKWIVTRFRVEQWELWWPLLEALISGRLEVCKWLSGCFDVRLAAEAVGSFPLQQCAFVSGNVQALEWLLDIFPMEGTPTSALVEYFLRNNTTAVGLEWITKKFPLAAWGSLYLTEGKTQRALIQKGLDNVPVVQLILQRISLPEKIMETAVDVALSVGNVAVADWLEGRYHITANLRPGCLRKLTSAASGGRESLKWLFQHAPADIFERDEVCRAVQSCAMSEDTQGALFLLQSQFETIETQVRHWAFEVSIIGRTNAGKSTLLNALLRKQVLPSSVQTQTGPWLHIRHDESREPALSLSRELTPQ
ncbi:hypothetical protein Pelo_11851 [Pelomyxa schiedti]|nr:hypothetical protein Pelo_11851 [Pelomyxa schiedti]